MPGFVRAGRVVILIVAIGLVPLAVGAVVIKRGSTRDARHELDRALSASAQSGTSDLTAYFDRARMVNLMIAQNPAFTEFYELQGTPHEKTWSRGPAFRRVNAALAYLQSLYPNAIGEACFIDRSGLENARIVDDPWGPGSRAAAPKDLSPDESANPFFDPTFALDFGRVYQARPYRSPDTHEWVISNSTLMPTAGKAKRAIIHFEITVESLRLLLARETGHHVYVVDRTTGAVIADTILPQRLEAPLGRSGDRRFASLTHVISQRGFVTLDGTRTAWIRVPHADENANDWLLVATAPSVESSLIGVNRTTLALLALLLFLAALPIAYRWGRLNKNLSEREQDLHESQHRYRILFEEAEAGRRLLAEQNDSLRAVDKMKDDFVASVSHELRTPLTSINGYLELVMDGEAGELGDEQRDFLGIVRRNAERLLRVVGDLLDVAQFNAAEVVLERAPVDLAALAEQAVDAVRPLAEERGIAVALERKALGLLEKVEGDADRLGQVIDNLLTNAVKFTPTGGRVEVNLFAEEGLVKLEVSDTGMGISKEDVDHLFERFFRTSDARVQAIQGTGLGLSIAAAIVDAHGGSIEVESELGAGTTFRVVLPLVRALEQAAA
jgi:signal transduction histidine kinase